MKRIDTMKKEEKAAYFKTLKLAIVYGKFEFVCCDLDCKDCPIVLTQSIKSCTEEKTAEEWIAWAEEELEYDIDI